MRNKQELPVKELEAEILAYLDSVSNKPGGKRTKPGCNLVHGKACALGTCVDNQPRVTPIDIYHDGLTVWIAAEPGGKIANIMRNPNVSVGVYEPVDHSREQKSMQLWGTAEIINLKNNPEAFNGRFAAFGLGEAMQGMVEEYSVRGKLPAGQEDATFLRLKKMFNLIKITPQKIKLLQMLPGAFPIKKIWEPGKAYQEVNG